MRRLRDLLTFGLAGAIGAAAAPALAQDAPGGGQPTPPAGDAQALFVGRFDPFAGKSLEQKVQALADRELIRDLTSTYAQRVAQGVSIADLFTDDGVFIERRQGGVARQEIRGRRDLDLHFGRMRTPGTTMPMIHNHLISVHGDEATAIASIELRITQDGQSMIASGFYQDRLRRENGRWRFAKRDVTFFHWVPLQEGWAKPAAPAQEPAKGR